MAKYIYTALVAYHATHIVSHHVFIDHIMPLHYQCLLLQFDMYWLQLAVLCGTCKQQANLGLLDVCVWMSEVSETISPIEGCYKITHHEGYFSCKNRCMLALSR